jgi:hypothetical protein
MSPPPPISFTQRTPLSPRRPTLTLRPISRAETSTLRRSSPRWPVRTTKSSFASLNSSLHSIQYGGNLRVPQNAHKPFPLALALSFELPFIPPFLSSLSFRLLVAPVG